MGNLDELLVGREMSAVCFVRDYVEFHFDGPIVRALTPVWGVSGRQGWHFDDPDAAARLRGFIGLTIFSVQLDERVSLELRFVPTPARERELAEVDPDDLDRLVLPLDDDARSGPEAAHVVGVDHRGITSTRHLWIF